METPATVYFTDMRARLDRSLLVKFDLLLKKADFDQIDFDKKMTAIKLHFGEPGNLATIRPNFVASVVRKIRTLGGKPFLTDCNTLYFGMRSNAIDHLQAAMENGFNRIAVGCDVIIADGLTGKDAVEVPVNLKRVKNAKIGAALVEADVIVSLSHFKGHESTGFGGALKNAGMGCASRKGKLEMHSASKPSIDEKLCVACGTCIKNCPEQAISYNANKIAQINYDKCIGCGQCIASCHYGAAHAKYDESVVLLNEKMAEYAYAVLKDKPQFHINFMMNISPNCDCWNANDQAIVPDVGIAASFDPVALDRACVDLINQSHAIRGSALDGKNWQPGGDLFNQLYPETRWQDCLKHAEEIGVGSQEYQLITIK